jgi:hypothetical protein
MKKIVRLTERDLTRLVKRIIKESSEKKVILEFLGSPMLPWYNELRAKGYSILHGGKDQRNIGGNDDYYTYVGNSGTNDWKFYESEALFDGKLQDELLNWNSKKWKIVKNPSLIKKLNTEAEAIESDVYDILQKEPTVKNIVRFLKASPHWLSDNEAWAEAAFMAINNIAKYKEVKKALGKDPYQFAKSFMDTSQKYHKIPIDQSMKRLGLLK